MVRPSSCAALVALAVLAGCGGAEQAADSTVPPRPVAAADTRIEGATPAQAHLLRSILETFGRTGITRLVLSEPGKDFEPQAAGARELMAYYEDDQDNQSHWEGNLVAGAFNTESREQGIADVVGFHDGVMGYEGRLGPPQKFSHGPSLDELKRDVTRTIANQGGHLRDLHAFELAGHPALSVTVQADHAAEFLVNGYPAIEAAAVRAGVGGAYVEILGPDGVQAQVTYGISLGGIEMGSIGPRSVLEGCGPDHSRPRGTEPPPCPYQGPRPYVLPGTIPQRVASDVVGASTVHDARFVDAGPGRQVREMCRWAHVDGCPSASGDAVVWVVASDDHWAVVDDASGDVIASG